MLKVQEDETHRIYHEVKSRRIHMGIYAFRVGQSVNICFKITALNKVVAYSRMC